MKNCSIIQFLRYSYLPSTQQASNFYFAKMPTGAPSSTRMSDPDLLDFVANVIKLKYKLENNENELLLHY